MNVVMFSGGAGSWAMAKRVAIEQGTQDLVLLFADTLVEDPDLYRFLREAAANVGGELITVQDGRTPFEVFRDDRFLGNARLANCSKYLKQRPCRKWLEAHCSPETTTLYVGIDWSETHRVPAIVKGWAPYCVECPLTDRPYLEQHAILAWLRDEGIEPPVGYAEGFGHNNCLAQGCVRGGQAYWANMLRNRRTAYLTTEAQELNLRDFLDADVAMLRDRTGGTVTPMTLAEFRSRQEAKPGLFDADEWGDCGCFVDAPLDLHRDERKEQAMDEVRGFKAKHDHPNRKA